MRLQYENLLIGNFLLFLDHHLSKKGEAYSNHQSLFYPISGDYQNRYTYAAPFKQWVCDESISGAVNPYILSGVHLGDVPVYPSGVDGRGVAIDPSGFLSITPYHGQVNFSKKVDVPISGCYAVKDFNLYLTNQTEEDLLFETIYQINPKTYQDPKGLPSDHKTFPAIFIKDIGGKNIPLAFGGADLTRTMIRCIVLADSSFDLDAACSITKDLVGMEIPLISEKNMPFDSMGSYLGGVNYENLTKDITYKSYKSE